MRKGSQYASDLLASRLGKLRLSSRARNCLRQVRCETIGDLCKLTANRLLMLPNFGLRSLREVREKLAEHGLALRDDGGQG